MLYVLWEKWLVEGKDVFANEWYAIGLFENRDRASQT